MSTAPEEKYADSAPCSCSVVGAGRGGTWLLVVAGLPIGMAIARRWRSKRTKRVGGGRANAAMLGALALTLTLPQVAHAQSADPPPTAEPPVGAPIAPPTLAEPQAVAPTPAVPPATTEPKGGHVVTAEEQRAVEKEETHQSTFGIYLAGAGSVSNPGIAGMAGLRLRLSEHWVVGLDGEMNGWIGTNSGRLRTGSANIYGSVIVRFPLKYKQVNLRSTLQAGTATQMVELVGVPKGSTGIFLGLNPIGIEWKLTGHLYAIIYPLGIALPITQLTGAPFSYPQYRTTLGLELSF